MITYYLCITGLKSETMESWSVEETIQWLEKNEFHDYAGIFRGKCL